MSGATAIGAPDRSIATTLHHMAIHFVLGSLHLWVESKLPETIQNEI